MRFLIIALCLMVSGCDREISRSYGQSRVEVRDIYCTHAGYCMDCGLSFDGKFDCGLRFKPSCGGTQRAQVKVTPVKIKYESGDVSYTEQTQTVETLGTCG